jgi:hypothetical protein
MMIQLKNSKIKSFFRPYDEMIFERTDSPPHGTTDCIQTLTLTNVGDKILTFKIKTTSPDKFRVKPGCSLLHPGESATISVYLLKGDFKILYLIILFLKTLLF